MAAPFDTGAPRTTADLLIQYADYKPAKSSNRQLQRDLIMSLDTVRSQTISAKDAPHLAKGDAQTGTDGAITTGTPNFTSASNLFVATDVGKTIVIIGAGPAGAVLTTTILAYTGAGAVTLAANAGTTIAGATWAFGTDDTAALASWRLACEAIEGKGILPRGKYLSTVAFAPTANFTICGIPRASILLFVGATDGLLVNDAVNHFPHIHIMGGLEVQTINPNGLRAVSYDTPTYGAGLCSLGDIYISKVGVGRWAQGFFGDNFEVGQIRSLNIFNSCTKAIKLQNFCNALAIDGYEITGGTVGDADATFLRGIEIDHCTDPWILNGTVQGYFAQSAIRIVNGSSPTFGGGTHVENTNAAPSDGADVVIDASSNVNLNDIEGGSIAYTGVIRGGKVSGGDHAAVTFGVGVQGVRLTDCRASSILDNDGNNGWENVRDSTGAQYINKLVSPEYLKPHVAGASATLAGLNGINSGAVLGWPNGAVICVKDSGGTYRDIWIPLSGANQMIFSYLAATGAMIFRSTTPTTRMQVNDAGVGIGAAGTLLAEVKKYSPSLTPASVAANSVVEQSFAVVGLVPGDHVTVSGPAPVAGTACIGARCGVADNVILTFINTTAGALTPSAGFYRITQIR